MSLPSICTHLSRYTVDQNESFIAPIRHWTPQRIKTHIFVCVLTYLLHSLARLGDIKEYSLEGQKEHYLTKLSDEQFKLNLIFNSQ